MSLIKNKVIGGNAKLVRNINRAAILNLIRENQPISRVDISRITKLNKSTVSSIVSELLEQEYIIEELVADSNVGRNPFQLRLKPGKFYVGAINFDTKIIRVAIVGIDGKIVARDEFNPPKNTPDDYASHALDAIDNLKQKLNISALERIGVTIAGLINPATGTVLVAPNLGWKNVELGAIFREHQKVPCTVIFQNDAEASALAELWFGHGEINNFNNFIFVSVGAGLGTGIVINRKVFEGHSYAAGEFGHLNIFGDGEPCVCGSSGCWEAYASDRATVKRYIKQKGLSPNPSKPMMVNDVIEAAQSGEKTAQDVLKETGLFLGLGISNIIRALDPPAIVIGGHILQAWNLILDDLIAGISRRGFFDLEKQVKVLPSSLKERPRLIGAATLALEQIFSDYKITR